MNFSVPLYANKDKIYFDQARTDIKILLPRNMSRVLEIGCGAGATMRWLRSLRHVDHASGIELVAEVAKLAATTFEEIIVGNIEEMNVGFPAQSFDVIIALDVLEHLVDPWKILKLCHFLLKPGGVMIASIPNVAHYTVSIPLMLRGLWTYRNDGLLDRTHLRFFVAGTAVELMTSSGLIVDQVEYLRIAPAFLNGVSERFGGSKLRWYAVKIMSHLPGSHLFDFRYLIRVRRPD